MLREDMNKAERPSQVYKNPIIVLQGESSEPTSQKKDTSRDPSPILNLDKIDEINENLKKSQTERQYVRRSSQIHMPTTNLINEQPDTQSKNQDDILSKKP